MSTRTQSWKESVYILKMRVGGKKPGKPDLVPRFVGYACLYLHGRHLAARRCLHGTAPLPLPHAPTHSSSLPPLSPVQPSRPNTTVPDSNTQPRVTVLPLVAAGVAFCRSVRNADCSTDTRAMLMTGCALQGRQACPNLSNGF